MIFSSILKTVIEMSVVSSVLALIIIIVRKVFKRSIPKNFMFVLWMVLAVKLLIPVSIPSPASIYNHVDSSEIFIRIQELASEDQSDNTPDLPLQSTTPKENANNSYEAGGEGGGTSSQENIINGAIDQTEIKNNTGISGNEKSSQTSISTVIGIVYCSVFICILALLVSMYINMYVKIRRAEELKSDLFEQIKSKFKFGNKIKFCTFPGNKSTLVFGIFKPSIILPDNYDYKNESGGELEYIVMHEMQHYYHMDVLFNLIMLAAAAVHWFNPLVWISRRLFLKDMEAACDSRVIEAFTDDKRKKYANVIVDFASGKLTEKTEEDKVKIRRNGIELSAATIGFGKSNVKERVRFVMNYKKAGIIAISISLVLITAVIVIFATGASEKIKDNIFPGETQETQNENQENSEETHADSGVSNEPAIVPPETEIAPPETQKPKADPIKVNDSIATLAQTDDRYLWIKSFLENDVEACAKIALDNYITDDEQHYTDEMRKKIADMTEALQPISTLRFESYNVEETDEEHTLQFTFSICESEYDFFPTGEYCYLVSDRDFDMVCWDAVSEPLNRDYGYNTEWRSSTNQAKQLVAMLMPDCYTFSYGQEDSLDYDLNPKAARRTVDEAIYYMCKGEWAESVTKEEFQATAKALFGFENYEASNNCIYLEDGKYMHSGHGGFIGEYIVDKITENDNQTVIDIQYFGDRMKITKGHLVRYTLKKADSKYGYCVEKVEIIKEGYRPYGVGI